MENLMNITQKLKNVNIIENKSVLTEFEYLFNKNANTIKDILSKENNLLKTNYQYNKLLKSFENIKEYDFDKLKGYTSIGRAVCISNGDTYFLLELFLQQRHIC